MANRPYATNAPAPIACSLGAGELGDRVAAWRELTARVVRRIHRPGRVTSVYPGERDLVERLTQLIDAERECCPLLQFSLREADDGLHVTLEYPDGFEELLGSVLG